VPREREETDEAETRADAAVIIQGPHHREGMSPMERQQKQVFATVASAQATGDEPSMLISTITLDRDSDILVPEGIDVSDYMKNPVVGVGHFRGEGALLPVGLTTRLDVTPGRGIKATWKWLTNDPVADRVRNAFDQGILRAASVGFLPQTWSDNSQGGRTYSKWSLLEWSLVPIPANPAAVRSLKALGLWDDDAELTLEIADDEPYLEITEDFAARLATRRGMSAAHLIDMDAPTFDVDPQQFRAVLAETVGEGFARAVRAAVSRAVNQAHGRVD